MRRCVVRICAAADIHYPRTDPSRCAALAEAMCESDADVLVLAGDLSTGPEKHYRQLLRLFRGFEGPRLLVPGNHDLWSIARRPDTQRRYCRTLRNIAESNGFHYLPGNPFVFRDVGFVGSIGWYDYSLRQTQSPVPGVRVTPLHARRTPHGPELDADFARRNVPWEELTEADYAGQALMWSQESVWKQLVWNDSLYVAWGDTDPATTQRLARELARDIEAVQARVDYWVGVTHCVPFAELAGEPSVDVEGAFVRAFLGSPVFGRTFVAHPKCRLVIFGHRHEQQVLSVGDVVAANCSVGDGTSGPLLLTVGE
jgi:3',5'-cyclic AMP phosphodiesterase CpdA